MRLLGFREPVANPHNFCKAKKLCGFTTKEPQRKTKRETNAYAMLQQNRYPQTGTQIIWPAIMQATYRSFAFPKRRTSGTSLHGQRKLCGNHPGWFSAKAIFSYLFFECHLPSAHRNTAHRLRSKCLSFQVSAPWGAYRCRARLSFIFLRK